MSMCTSYVKTTELGTAHPLCSTTVLLSRASHNKLRSIKARPASLTRQGTEFAAEQLGYMILPWQSLRLGERSYVDAILLHIQNG